MVLIKEHEGFEIHYENEKFVAYQGTEVKFDAQTEAELKKEINAINMLQKKKEQEEKHESKFRITWANPELIKTSFNLIKQLSHEGKVVINKEELKIIQLDPANVAMIIMRIVPSSAIEWDLKKDVEFSVNFSTLCSILNKATPHDILILGRDEKGSIKVTIKGEDTSEFIIKTVELEDRNHKIPNLAFLSTIKMSGLQLQKQIQKAHMIADSCKFMVGMNEFSIEAEGDLGVVAKMNNTNSARTTITTKGVCKSKYSIEYLNMMMGAKKINDAVKIEMGQDFPLKLTYCRDDFCEVQYILAPRVEND